ncbi:MAG: HNH endonuclease [Nostoc sp.]|uniref:HNH endonuclease n=1 Tax=Nostoc sp. TaxID=1180 RepID=UPI002FEFA85C
MSRLYINAELRRLVSDRAAHICKYCLYPEVDGLSCQVDHVISVKHGGSTKSEIAD